MKVATAASERPDSRARPQTPCPDVQPEPSAAPVPISSPATAIIGRFDETDCSTGPATALTSRRAAISPATKLSRQPRSTASDMPTAPRVMPAIPAMRPKSSIIMTAESPIRAPPDSEAKGVNSVGTMGGMGNPLWCGRTWRPAGDRLHMRDVCIS